MKVGFFRPSSTLGHEKAIAVIKRGMGACLCWEQRRRIDAQARLTQSCRRRKKRRKKQRQSLMIRSRIHWAQRPR
jgi:hypothetical protein